MTTSRTTTATGKLIERACKRTGLTQNKLGGKFWSRASSGAAILQQVRVGQALLPAHAARKLAQLAKCNLADVVECVGRDFKERYYAASKRPKTGSQPGSQPGSRSAHRSRVSRRRRKTRR